MRYITVAIFLFASKCLAQVQSNFDRFAVPYARGCAPLTIEVEELDDFGDISRQYIYEDGIPETIDQSHTYNSPGVYNIIQILGVDVDPKTDTLTIEVIEPQEIQFNLWKCNDLGAAIEIENDFYNSFLLDWGDGSTSLLEDGFTETHAFPEFNTYQVAVSGLLAQGAPNCPSFSETVVIEEFNNAGSITDITTTRPCLDLLNTSLNLRIAPQQLYNLEISIDDGNNFSMVQSGFSDDSVSIENIDLDNSNNQICFRLNAISPCNNSSIAGDPFCIENPFQENILIENTYSTYHENDIVIQFDDLGTTGFQGRRQISGFDFEPLDTMFAGFTDRSISPIRQYLYEISFEDECGNMIDPTFTNPPFLELEEIAANDYEIRWTEPTNDLIENPDIQLVVSNQDGSSNFTIFNPSQNQRVRLQEEQGAQQQVNLLYTHPTSGISIFSNTISLNYEFEGFIPDAFTPNNDGINDQLRVFGLSASTVNFKVFNRWGEVITTSIDPNNLWDGRLGDQEAPEGKYFYVLIFENVEGNNVTQQGSFVLLRK